MRSLSSSSPKWKDKTCPRIGNCRRSLPLSRSHETTFPAVAETARCSPCDRATALGMSSSGVVRSKTGSPVSTSRSVPSPTIDCFTRSPNDSPTIDFPSREGSGKGVQCRDPSYEPRDCASNHFRFAGGSGQPPISRGFTRRLDDSNAIAQASREASGRIAHPNLHRVKIGLRPARCDASRRNASKIGRAEIRPHRDPATHRHCSISVSSGNVSMLAIIRIS